jgi:carbon starvation protein
VIFIGAVHDFSALVASVRHGANSICEVAKQHLGKRAFLALISFIWLALIYVLIAFADVTASTFMGLTIEQASMGAEFNKGGAVAAASTIYLMLALLMGVIQRKFNPPMWLTTVIFVPATLGAVWLGTKFSTILLFDMRTWHVAILAYCFFASLLPLWLLQQPRGYLGGFVLYMALGLGLVGIVFGGFAIQMPAFNPAPPAGMQGMLFPFLFVTIACGACSGFHGLVCGGTTSKQIARESDCKPIGFGAMLLEGMVAVIALATLMIVAPGDSAGRPPGTIYGDGLARFFAVIFGPEHMVFAATFGAMAFSTFIFDTLDVATRLGRYLLQELTQTTSRAAGVLAAAVTAGAALLILLSAKPGSWQQFWILFGTSNQLLAGLTLLGITVWLYRTGRRYWYTLLPMMFVLVVTVWALLIQIGLGWKAMEAKGLHFDPAVVNAVVALALFVLAALFVGEGARSVLEFRKSGSGEPIAVPGD